MCPCGIVYSLKFNLRAESPRDYMDLLMSWQHIPNIVIYDFARGLATHGNIRFPTALPFSPHEGRLLNPTAENIQRAKEGRVTVTLPWLVKAKETPDINGHPLTGSSEHYVLYDKLHEGNTKDEKDVLRKIELVPELAGRINSQVVEQFFSQMEKNNYFLNMMKPSAQIFMIDLWCGYKCGRFPVRERDCLCLPPLCAHDSRHRLLSNEYVPVACVQPMNRVNMHISAQQVSFRTLRREYDRSINWFSWSLTIFSCIFAQTKAGTVSPVSLLLDCEEWK